MTILDCFGRWIDWKALHDRGFQGVVFDMDNTLTAPNALEVWPALATSLQECQSVFEGRMALLSNSAGTVHLACRNIPDIGRDSDLI